MRDVAFAVARLEHARRVRAPGGEIAAGGALLGLGRRLEDVLEDALLVDLRRRHAPVRLDAFERGRGGLGIGVQHGDKRVAPDQRDSQQPGGGGGVELCQRRAMRGRAQDARVEHPREADVGRILRAAGHLFRRIEPLRRAAHHAEFGGGAQNGFLAHDTRDLRALRKFAVADPACRLSGDGDHAVRHDEIAFRHAEFFRGQPQQHRARFRGRGAQRRPEHARGQRAEGPHVPGTLVGVAHDHVYRLERDAQLLGRHLRLRGHHALAHLDFAGKHGDPAICADQQIGVEILGVDVRPVLRKQRRGIEADEHHDAAADEFEEGATVDTAGSAHDFAPIWREAGLDRADDPLVRAAAAQLLLHPGHDRFARWLAALKQERIGIHDHPRRAVAALEAAVVDKCPLQRMQSSVAGEALDGEHFMVAHFLERCLAGAHRLAVDDHGAGAAQARPAAVLRAGERQVGAQDP